MHIQKSFSLNKIAVRKWFNLKLNTVMESTFTKKKLTTPRLTGVCKK